MTLALTLAWPTTIAITALTTHHYTRRHYTTHINILNNRLTTTHHQIHDHLTTWKPPTHRNHPNP